MAAGDLVGATVGHYQVEKELAEGGMAKVYVAADLHTGRKVALKALLSHLTSNRSVAERFMNEARAMGKIRHPGVIDVFDVLSGPHGEMCIVMELLNGRNLREHLEAFGPMAPAQAVPVMRAVCDALAAAHVHGIIHRDLKPENIVLLADPLGGLRPKVLDFGIAKIADANNVQTATNTSMGTATYMAPEQFRSARDVDARADVYALGCLFFEMLVGHPPFGGRNLFEQMDAHLNKPPPLGQLPATTPPTVAALIDRMLAKSRDQRLGSLAEAVAVLDGQANLPPAAPLPGHAHGQQPPPPQQQPPPPHSHPHLTGHGQPYPTAHTAIVEGARRSGGGSSWIIALVAIIVVAAGVAAALALT